MAAAADTSERSKSPESLLNGLELNEQGLPKSQGLYNPDNEKDACGVGFVVNIDGIATRKVCSK